MTTMSYLYDPDGRRVVRLQNGSIVKQYFYDAMGHMITEANASGAILRAEIYAGGRHLATWSNGATYFNHADWLGTERVRTDSSGTVCEAISSLPFGDGEQTSGGCTPTPTFLTGKERDGESGLDHSPYRQYISSSGRWMTPDPVNLTWKRLPNPANTLNKYIYAGNNPLLYVDRSGMDITVFYRAPNGQPSDFGHVLLAVTNQATGQVRFADYYPLGGRKDTITPWPGSFNVPNADRLKDHAALTIRTTPEVAQELIGIIDRLSKDTPDFFLPGSDCATMSAALLEVAGIDVGYWLETPEDLWAQVYAKYSEDAIAGGYPNTPYRYQTGKDFGVPMSVLPLGVDPLFNLDILERISKQMAAQQSHPQPLPRGCVTTHDSATGETTKSCD